jgi:hypothetical protein
MFEPKYRTWAGEKPENVAGRFGGLMVNEFRERTRGCAQGIAGE